MEHSDDNDETFDREQIAIFSAMHIRHSCQHLPRSHIVRMKLLQANFEYASSAFNPESPVRDLGYSCL
jgi:hypothetical protein